MKWRGSETPHQGIRCLLPPDQIFPEARCGAVKSEWLTKRRCRNTNRTAAQTGGGGYHKVYLKMGTVLSGEPCDIFPDVINARVYLVDHLIMPETDNMPAQCFHQNIPMYIICLTASISVKMPSLAINFNVDLMAWDRQVNVVPKVRSTFSLRNDIVAASLLATPAFYSFHCDKHCNRTFHSFNVSASS